MLLLALRKFLILRRPRRGCLEGRTALVQVAAHQDLFDVNARFFGNPPPAWDLLVDQRGERRGRAADRLAADGGKALLGLCLVNDAVELGVEPGDDPRRGAGRPENGE